MFQANALQFCQIDSCRLGGVNEILAVYLMAAKFGGDKTLFFSFHNTNFFLLNKDVFNVNLPEIHKSNFNLMSSFFKTIFNTLIMKISLQAYSKFSKIY